MPVLYSLFISPSICEPTLQGPLSPDGSVHFSHFSEGLQAKIYHSLRSDRVHPGLICSQNSRSSRSHSTCPCVSHQLEDSRSPQTEAPWKQEDIYSVHLRTHSLPNQASSTNTWGIQNMRLAHGSQQSLIYAHALPGDMGTFAYVLETFLVVTVQRGGELLGIYWVEARDAVKHTGSIAQPP